MPDNIVTKPITQDQANQLRDAGWWIGLSQARVVKFQLFTDRLCMPFGLLHELTELELSRKIFPHEFGPAGRLQQEFLIGSDRPSFNDLVALLPEADRHILTD